MRAGRRMSTAGGIRIFQICSFIEVKCFSFEECISENVKIPDDADAVVYTSASNVNRFLKENYSRKKKIKAFSIGPKTTAALHDNGISDVVEAYECSYDSLIQSLKEL